MEIIEFGLIGIFSGLIAGLVGLAGGIVIVPALIWIYGKDALFDAILISWVAVFTNSVAAMYKQLKVRPREERMALLANARFFLVGIAIATPVVALAFNSDKGAIDARIVALLQLCLAAAMLVPIKPAAEGEPRRKPNLLDTLLGCIIGGVSTIIGVGGGTYTIAYFAMVAKSQFQDAIATANMSGFAIGALSILGFMASYAISSAHAAPGSVAGLTLPVWGAVSLILCGMLAAPVGVKLSRTLPTKTLKQILIATIMASSIKLLLA